MEDILMTRLSMSKSDCPYHRSWNVSADRNQQLGPVSFRTERGGRTGAAEAMEGFVRDFGATRACGSITD